jgi:hypothetical protein
MYKTLEITQTGSVAFVNLNRPEARNAMNRLMVRELLDYFNGDPPGSFDSGGGAWGEWAGFLRRGRH